MSQIFVRRCVLSCNCPIARANVAPRFRGASNHGGAPVHGCNWESAAAAIDDQQDCEGPGASATALGVTVRVMSLTHCADWPGTISLRKRHETT